MNQKLTAKINAKDQNRRLKKVAPIHVQPMRYKMQKIYKKK